MGLILIPVAPTTVGADDVVVVIGIKESTSITYVKICASNVVKGLEVIADQNKAETN